MADIDLSGVMWDQLAIVGTIGGIIFYAFCAFFSGITACEKERSFLGWFMLGLLFGPLILVIISVIGLSQKEEEIKETKETRRKFRESLISSGWM